MPITSVVGFVRGVTMMLRFNILIVKGVGYGDFNNGPVVLAVLFMLAIGWISKMVPIVPVTQISSAIKTWMVWH